MIEIKKSKFYAYKFEIKTLSDVEDCISKIKKEHKKASHIVYAYILNSPYSEKYYDDQEPSRCAGYPILNLMQKKKLTDTLIVSVRYFGGIKLGAGGLIRAYVNSAKEVI